MSEQYTYGFVVALAFDAAGSEAMPYVDHGISLRAIRIGEICALT